MDQHRTMTDQTMADSAELTDPQDILHDVLTDIWNAANEPMWAMTDFLIEGCTPEQVQALIERARKTLAACTAVQMAETGDESGIEDGQGDIG